MLRFLVFFLFASRLALGQVPTSAGLDLVVTSEPTPSLIVTADNQIGSPSLFRDDAIIAIDGKPVFSLSDLGRPEFCRNDGSVFNLTVIRPGVGAMRNPVIAGPNCMRVAAVIRRIVRPVVEVRSVAPQSPAQTYGLQAGDILLAADGKALYGPPEEMQSQAARVVSDMTSTAGVALLFSRNGTIYEQKSRAALSAPSSSVTLAQSSATNVTQPSSAAQASASAPDPPAATSTPAEAQPPANPVVTVQQFLRSQQRSHRFPITGIWNAQTSEYVSGFVQALERKPLSAYPWTGPTDGVYSDAFSAYLKHAVAVMKNTNEDDQAWAAQLEAFALAMDELKRKGIYQEPQLEAQDSQLSASPSSQSNSSDAFGSIEQSLKPAFLWLLNGMLSDFGDEAWCALFHGAEGFSGCHREARHDLESFDAQYHILAMILYFGGALYNPITLTLIQFGVKKDTSPPFAMLWGFSLGFIDFFFYFLGDLWTRQFSFKGMDFGLIFVSAIFAMVVTAFCISLQLTPLNLITWRPKPKWQN